MANLAGLVPEIEAFHRAQERVRQQDQGNLQNQVGLMGLLKSLQAQKQEEADRADQLQIRQTIQQTGGDPAKTIERLMASGHPKAIELATKMKGMLPKPAEAYTLPPGAQRYGPNNQVVATAPMRPDKGPAASPLGKLLTERDALPAGDPRRVFYDQAITSAAKNAGGGVNVSLGGISLGKEGSNKVDAALLDTTAGMMRLSTIEGQFKPEFQQTLPRIGAEWSALKDKAGFGIPPQDKQFLTEFSAYKRNSINSMNQYIKEITGAAMSEAEAQRILRGMPNPGQGMFDGDSPTEFKAKLDDALKQTKMALARYEYIKRKGISLSDAQGNSVVPLDKMPQIMNERGKELEVGFKQANPNITPEQLSQQVRGILAKEFGLVR